MVSKLLAVAIIIGSFYLAACVGDDDLTGTSSDDADPSVSYAEGAAGKDAAYLDVFYFTLVGLDAEDPEFSDALITE